MPVDLKELRRLHEAATPGPWFKYMRTVTVEENGWDVEVAECSNNARGTVEADAALIAAARNALPELLDRLEAAESENARLREELNGLTWVQRLLRRALEMPAAGDPLAYAALRTSTAKVLAEHLQQCRAVLGEVANVPDSVAALKDERDELLAAFRELFRDCNEFPNDPGTAWYERAREVLKKYD